MSEEVGRIRLRNDGVGRVHRLNKYRTHGLYFSWVATKCGKQAIYDENSYGYASVWESERGQWDHADACRRCFKGCIFVVVKATPEGSA